MSLARDSHVDGLPFPAPLRERLPWFLSFSGPSDAHSFDWGGAVELVLHFFYA